MAALSHEMNINLIYKEKKNKNKEESVKWKKLLVWK